MRSTRRALAALLWSAGALVATRCGAAGVPAPAPDTAAAAPPAAAIVPSGALRLVERGVFSGDAAHPLAEPSGVTADVFGRVWVSDAALHKVRRWDAGGQPLDETGALGSEDGHFRRPGALARMGSLGVAVLDVENRRVSGYDHHLRLLGAAVDLASADLEARVGRVDPVSLAADRGGAFYVADAERDRILVFDYAGAFQREIGGYGGGAGGFAGLLGVAAGARGTLVTIERPRGRSKRPSPADSTVGRARVQWLDAGGRVVNMAWTPAWSAGASETGLSVALDDSGRVVVAAERSGELCVLSGTGACLARLSGLASPRAVAFAPDGTLLVAEAGAARVRRFALRPGAE